MAAIGRATYSGMLKFGAVIAPIKVIKGYDDSDPELKVTLQHKSDKGAVKAPRTCSVCDEVLTPDEIGKAVNGIAIDDTLLDSFKVPSDKVIEITLVTPMADIDARLFDAPRYLVPSKGGEDALRAIVDGLRRSTEPLAGIGKVAEREHEKIVAVYVQDGALVIQDLRWPETLRNAADYAAAIGGKSLTPKMETAVDAMFASMRDAFDPTQYRDEKGALRDAALRAIAAGGTVTAGADVPEMAKPADDLLAQIEASIKMAKAKKKVA